MRILLLIVAGIYSLSVNASDLLESNLRKELKDGFVKTCIPNTSKQIHAITGIPSTTKTENYCDCMSVALFNDFTKSDYQFLKSTRTLPKEIESKRRDFQNYCANLHF